MRRSKRWLGPTGLMSLLLAVGACGGNTSGTADAEGSFEYAMGSVGSSEPAGDPQDGGIVTYGGFMEPRSMDPAVSVAAGPTGGNEMAAVYDTLMRYDSAEQGFVPQLAESLEHNPNGKVWTLRLRPGVKFSDGTSLDAPAVKASQERYAAYTAPEAATWNQNVKSVKVVDDLTLKYTMVAPFAWFGSVLSSGPGMVVAKASGPAGAKDFKPIGAGPYLFSEWKQGESIALTPNPDYWGGPPHLDELKFAYLGDQNTTRDAFVNGDIDAGYFRYPDVVDELLADDTRGYVNLLAVSTTALINGAQDRPGADVRVRKAMQLAIAPEQIRQRAYAGHGMASSRIFPEYSRWYAPEVEVLEPDAVEAKKLLDEAKADGYDGKITFLANNTPQVRDIGQTVKASLEAVGFEVELEYLPSSTEVTTRVAMQQDYDLVSSGQSFPEAEPYTKLVASLRTGGNQTFGVPTSPEMDAALDKLRGAMDQQTAKDATADIQLAYNDLVPFLTWMPIADLNALADDVYGVKEAVNSMVQFDRAWVG